MHNKPNNTGRTPPAGMPRQAPRTDRRALRGQTPAPAQTQQQPVTEEEIPVRRPSLVSRLLRRIGLCVLLVLALVLTYLFLLLGEPDEDAKYLEQPREESISMPMTALDIPGESDVQNLADAFGQPVLTLNHTPVMYKSRIYDTAFEGEYARCVTITYTLEDGQQLLAESIRPTAAVSLLKREGYTLDASALYTMGGLNAARMANDSQVCVFAQNESAVYAITCPVSHADELTDLLRYTTLILPSAGE